MFLEEAEVSYDFDVAAIPPSPATLEVIPQRIAVPISAYLSPDANESEIVVEVISSGVTEALAFDADLAANSLMDAPNTYPMVLRIKVRGRNSAGQRIETSDFSFPMQLCQQCLLDNPKCYTTCDTPWNNCVVD